MTATKNVCFHKNSFLNTISTEQAGFTFGQPKRVDEKSLAVVVPIFGPDDEPRLYRTFPEMPKVQVTDTGKIDEMTVHNDTHENVFIRSGTLFVGKTQSRALQQSVILAPNEKLNVAVRCVHASHGISGGASVSYGGTTPLDMDKGNYGAGYSPASQHTFWANVSKTSASFMSCGGVSGMSAGKAYGGTGAIRARQHTSPPMDNLKENFDKFAKDFESVLAKVGRLPNQAGLAMISDGGVETIEVFDHADSWKAFHEDAVKRLGTNLLKTDRTGVFEFKPDRAADQIKTVLNLPYRLNLLTERLAHRDDPRFEVYGLTAENYVGEMALMDDKVIHLVILKRDN